MRQALKRTARLGVASSPLSSAGRGSAHDTEELYRLAIRATNDMVWDLNFQTGELLWNDALFVTLGYKAEAVESTLQWWVDHLHPDDRDQVAQKFDQVVESGEEQFTAEYRFRRSDGTYAWIYDRGYIVRDARGRPKRGIGVMQDQTARKLSEEALRKSEALNRSIIEANPDCVSILDLDGTVVFSNKAALEAYGLSSGSELVGRRWGYLLDPKIQKEMDGALATAASGKSARLTVHVSGQHGGSRWYESIVAPINDADGMLVRYVVMSRDITDHKSAEREIRWIANHDALTKLPNRLLFQQRLDALIAKANRRKSTFALLLIDIDDFKQLNDTLGHDAGDMLLCTVAERLRKVVRKHDVVARLGGDEFAILLKYATSPARVRKIAEDIIGELKQPWIYSNRVLDCQASIGVSIFGSHASTGSELLKNADVALYKAKQRGRCRTALFEPQMRASVQKRMEMVGEARRAIRDNLVVPYYQPQIDLRTGEVAGYEALLRVKHPNRGTLLPAHVKAALEDAEVAAEIGERMIELVARDARRWLSDGFKIGHIALNAAPADFRGGEFAERLLQTLRRHRLPADMFQLEVTETVFLGRGAEHVESALKCLSKSGMRIAMDDFGTGYASLSHLRQFPIDVIKIDRSFVRKMTQSARDAAIVRAVITLGKSLGLDVIAEGIERPEEEAMLKDEGCWLVQGFLYGKPMSADRLFGRCEKSKVAA